MLPLIRKQGSVPNFDHRSEVSPNSAGSGITPFADASPRAGIETSYFGYRLPSPTSLQHGPNPASFHFKRGRSDESVDSTVDGSPTPIHSAKIARSQDSSVRSNISEQTTRIAAVVTHDAHDNIDVDDLERLPVLRFGEEGRAKLKSALSDLVRRDPEIKERVEAIGKIRLASMHQLMRMAKVAGLWSYAEALVKEHDSLRQYKRTS